MTVWKRGRRAFLRFLDDKCVCVGKTLTWLLFFQWLNPLYLIRKRAFILNMGHGSA